AAQTGNCSLLQGRRFYCREWALDKLWRCLENRSVPGQPAGLLVTGGPGAGKTALCTEVVWPTSKAGVEVGLASRCLASHFCQREDQRSMGLVCPPPGYKEILNSPSVSSTLEPLTCQKDPDNTFKRAVLGPLLDLSPPAQTLMMVVDSIDVAFEAGIGGGKSGSIAELLAANQHLLPGWLLLVCSVRRHNKAVCKMFSGEKR
uniref:Orc1-like AAA ATPase domain-containing protein n=1 Tax=Labrus bergylta TaxID=56723 RepID=A0A3Q3FLU5_9LABR